MTWSLKQLDLGLVPPIILNFNQTLTQIAAAKIPVLRSDTFML